MIDIEDIKLRSWGNEPYIYKSVPIFPKTIKEIIRDGYQNFLYNLNLACISKSRIFPKGVDIGINTENSSVAELLYVTNNFGLLNDYLDSIQYFILSEISAKRDSVLLINGNEFTFEDIQNICTIIKIQNSMSDKSDSEEFNPKNERVRQLKEQQRKYKEKIAKLKKEANSSEESLTFRDYLSSLVIGSGMSVNEVLQLNYYQFHYQLMRMQKYERYKESMDAFFHERLDLNKTKIAHWMTKIE